MSDGDTKEREKKKTFWTRRNDSNFSSLFSRNLVGQVNIISEAFLLQRCGYLANLFLVTLKETALQKIMRRF